MHYEKPPRNESDLGQRKLQILPTFISAFCIDINALGVRNIVYVKNRARGVLFIVM